MIYEVWLCKAADELTLGRAKLPLPPKKGDFISYDHETWEVVGILMRVPEDSSVPTAIEVMVKQAKPPWRKR